MYGRVILFDVNIQGNYQKKILGNDYFDVDRKNKRGFWSLNWNEGSFSSNPPKMAKSRKPINGV